jgi:hypothetical protein
VNIWTPTPDEALKSELQAALARPGASHVTPPRPVALLTAERVTGWLWGRMRTTEGTWLGLATMYQGRFFEGAQLGWHRADELRVLD